MFSHLSNGKLKVHPQTLPSEEGATAPLIPLNGAF